MEVGLIRLLLASAIALWSASGPAAACSMFNHAEGSRVLIGRNADWVPDTPGQVWFEPADDDTYGAMFFGVEHNGFPQGGINDQGLVLGMAAIPEIELVEDPTQPAPYWWMWEDILRSCATIDEALAVYEGYDIAALPAMFAEAHFMLTEASGHSVVIEGDTFLHKEGAYQIMTNYCLSQPELGGYPCGCYELIEERLTAGEAITDEYFVAIIEDARGDLWGGFTVFSLFYDLEAFRVTLFWEGDFEHPIEFDVLDEIAFGVHGYEMEELWEQAVEESLEDDDTGDDDTSAADDDADGGEDDGDDPDPVPSGCQCTAAADRPRAASPGWLVLTLGVLVLRCRSTCHRKRRIQ